jgi:hypothetical protein
LFDYALARSGRLEEAEQMIITNASDNVIAWFSLLGACRSRKDADRGKRVFF